MAIECKVSNSAVNPYKRVNHEAASKARGWITSFGKRQTVPAAVLGGVFSPVNLEAAQGDGLAIIWSHRLDDLRVFVESCRTTAGRPRRGGKGRGRGQELPVQHELTLERLDHLLVYTPPPVAPDSVGWRSTLIEGHTGKDGIVNVDLAAYRPHESYVPEPTAAATSERSWDRVGIREDIKIVETVPLKLSLHVSGTDEYTLFLDRRKPGMRLVYPRPLGGRADKCPSAFVVWSWLSQDAVGMLRKAVEFLGMRHVTLENDQKTEVWSPGSIASPGNGSLVAVL